jgi:heterotetrameric sarcosine oxidase gamma subunit
MRCRRMRRGRRPAARGYLRRFAVRCDRRVVVFTNNDSGYATADELAATGADMVCVVDCRNAGATAAAAAQAGVAVIPEAVVAWGMGPDDGATRLRAANASGHAAVGDLSSANTTFRLSGVAATELLCRGCSAPLDRPSFAPGICLTTKFGGFTVIIHRIDAPQMFDLHV